MAIRHLLDAKLLAGSDCDWLKKESYIHLRWVEGEKIMESF